MSLKEVANWCVMQDCPVITNARVCVISMNQLKKTLLDILRLNVSRNVREITLVVILVPTNVINVLRNFSLA